MDLPEGIRNHNPGNIEYNGIPWKGLANPPYDASGKCVFIMAMMWGNSMSKNDQDRLAGAETKISVTETKLENMDSRLTRVEAYSLASLLCLAGPKLLSALTAVAAFAQGIK